MLQLFLIVWAVIFSALGTFKVWTMWEFLGFDCSHVLLVYFEFSTLFPIYVRD